MKRSLRDARARATITERIQALDAECERGWGTMERAKLLPHLADGLRMALGETWSQSTRSLTRIGLMRYLVIHWLPWPKGKAKAPPVAFKTPARSWEQDRTALLELIERFATTPPPDHSPEHPLFGKMSARDWDVLQYRHLDHHITQWGG